MNNKINKGVRKSFLLMFTIFIITVIVACEKKDNNNGAENKINSEVPVESNVENNNDEEKELPKQEIAPAEITFYTLHSNDEETFNLRYGDILRAKFPQHTIKSLNASTGGSPEKMMTDKTKFDIFWATSGSFEGAAFTYDFAYDLTPLIKKHNIDLSSFDDAFNKVITGEVFGGRTYFLPTHADVQVTFVNKDVFEKFGVEVPKNNMTWDEFYQLSERMTRVEDDVKYVGFTPLIGQYIQNNQMSLPLLNRQTMTPLIHVDDKWQKYISQIFERHAHLWNGTNPVSLKAIDVLESFENSTQALMVYLPAVTEQRRDIYQKFDWDFIPVPTLSDYPDTGFQPYSVNFGINKLSENKDLAMEMIGFLATSEEAQTSFAMKAMGPVSKSGSVREAFGSGTSFSDKNWGATYYYKLAPLENYGGGSRAIGSIYEKYVVEVINNNMDLNTALRTAAEEATGSLENYKATLTAPGAN